MLKQEAKPIKVSRGVVGTNEWDGQPALLRSGHTHSTAPFPPWTLTRAYAARAYAAIVRRLHPTNKQALTCPQCYTPRGIPELLFVDVGESLRGPMCARCLAGFVELNPTVSGYAVLIFRADDIEKLPNSEEIPSTAAQLETLRKVTVPLKDLI